MTALAIKNASVFYPVPGKPPVHALKNINLEIFEKEFADVLAWLVTIANVVDVDLDEAVRRKYGQGCPGCGRLACTCPDAEKP